MQAKTVLLVLFAVVACVSVLESGAVAAASDSMRIENRFLVVQFGTRELSFSVTSKESGVRFVERATLAGREAQVQRLAVNHPAWGAGQTIQIDYRSGGADRLMLFPELPFLVLEGTLANGSDADATVTSVHPVRMVLDLQKEANGLRALGTAGLTGVGRTSNPGSYSFLAVADPESRAGFVAGWVTHERGSGLLFSDVEGGKVVVDARLDYGRLLLRPGRKVESETLLVGYFADARLGLEAYADAIARHYRIELPPQPTVYCTWYHAGASDERRLLASAEFAREHLVPFGFSVIQIDDGWQDGVKGNGPRRDFTKHRSDGPYPSGMRLTAEKIKELGLTPGIWFMPFAGTWNDPFFADKQYLFATKDGKPFDVYWGGTCFDLTNPKTREYVRLVASRITRDWGYTYVKLDGLWTGMAADILYINTGFKDDRLGETPCTIPRRATCKRIAMVSRSSARLRARGCISWAATSPRTCGRWAPPSVWWTRCASGRTTGASGHRCAGVPSAAAISTSCTVASGTTTRTRSTCATTSPSSTSGP
jgi:hypothetical protein